LPPISLFYHRQEQYNKALTRFHNIEHLRTLQKGEPEPDFFEQFIEDSTSPTSSEGPNLDLCEDDASTLENIPTSHEYSEHVAEPQNSPGFQASKETPSSTSSPNGKNLHFCRFCPKGFHAERNLASHIKTHTRPRRCPHPGCNERFADRKEILRHASKKHPSEQSAYICPATGCGAKFIGRFDSLQRHVGSKTHKEKFGAINLSICRSQK